MTSIQYHELPTINFPINYYLLDEEFLDRNFLYNTQVMQNPCEAEIRNKIPRTKVTHLPQLIKVEPIKTKPKTVRVKISSGAIFFMRRIIAPPSFFDQRTGLINNINARPWVQHKRLANPPDS